MRRVLMMSVVALFGMIPLSAWAQTTPPPDEAPAADAAPAADTAPAADAATAPAADAPSGDGAPATGPQVGPGGRELRTDYPGVPDAMQPRMSVDGVLTDPGDRTPEQAYELRVQELETRIDDLKANVFRSKSRIVLLRETLLGGRTAGSRAVITHQDELGGRFALKRALYRLDGNVQFNEIDRNGSLSEKGSFEIFNGSIGPGTHKLTVILQYQGSSTAFAYFQGYTFELSKECAFTVEQGMSTVLAVVPHEGGDATTSVEDRPRIKCEVTKSDVTVDDIAKSAEAPKKK